MIKAVALFGILVSAVTITFVQLSPVAFYGLICLIGVLAYLLTREEI